ncbi:MAG TPA: hypothetical protein VJH23_00695 [archaeon]|nr:hypothetical protein [archaeon]
MKGQASIELIIIITLALALSIGVLGKFSGVQEGIFTSASARQQLITEMEKLDTHYDVRGIATAECAASTSGNIRVNVTIKPDPKIIGTSPNTDDTKITPKVRAAICSTRNLGTKTVCIAYNDPSRLDCGQTCAGQSCT